MQCNYEKIFLLLNNTFKQHLTKTFRDFFTNFEIEHFFRFLSFHFDCRHKRRDAMYPMWWRVIIKRMFISRFHKAHQSTNIFSSPTPSACRVFLSLRLLDSSGWRNKSFSIFTNVSVFSSTGEYHVRENLSCFTFLTLAKFFYFSKPRDGHC